MKDERRPEAALVTTGADVNHTLSRDTDIPMVRADLAFAEAHEWREQGYRAGWDDAMREAAEFFMRVTVPEVFGVRPSQVTDLQRAAWHATPVPLATLRFADLADLEAES